MQDPEPFCSLVAEDDKVAAHKACQLLVKRFLKFPSGLGQCILEKLQGFLWLQRYVQEEVSDLPRRDT